ncbi:MAG: DUF1570 domain-containing protein [Planctomycetes bacterium]|nr:DUF1570 domain-containing protein [Planctomycetota bacterium]
MSTRPSKLVALLCGALLLGLPASADRLITKDGRILELKKARVLPDGSYQLVFESGEITCPKEFVASVEIEGDMSDYVPANEDEKKKLADGFVRYRGKWLSKAAYQAELNKQTELTKARTAELAAHSQFRDGWKKETKHFQIQSNTSPEILDYYAELLESYYDMMDQRVGIDPSPTLKRTKMKVCVYKNRPEFRALTKVDPGVAGFFNFVEGELHFYHDYQDPAISQWVALHEGTHLLTFLIEPQALPCIWINEGVADFFGSALVGKSKKGKLEIQPGQLSLERVLTVQQALKDGKAIPLEKLFFMPREEFQAFAYAHAWSFVYFLNTAKPEYEKGFKKFFKDFYTIGKGVAFKALVAGGNKYGSWKEVPPEEVRRLLLERLGVKDVAALEAEWQAYIAAIDIDAPLARYKRGLFTLQSSQGKEDLAAALADLEAAIEGGVNAPRAFWARGVLQLIIKGSEKTAAADFRKAVELAPLEGGFRANLAQMLGGLSLRTPSLTVQLSADDQEKLTGSEEALAEAEGLFRLACELDPENELLRESRDSFEDLLQKKGPPK